MLITSGVARSFLMPGPDEAMDLKPTGGSGGMLPPEIFLISGYGDAFWCNLMAKLYSAEITKKNQYKDKKNRDKCKVVQPCVCLNNWNKILLLNHVNNNQ